MLDDVIQNLEKPIAFPGIVDAVICINLTTRPDRKEKVIQSFPYQFRFFFATPHPTSPHDGCTQSHLSVIRIAKERGWKNVMVIEDDVELVKPLEQSPTFPSQYDMLYFGGICMEVIGAWWQPWTQGRFICMHAYIVHHSFYNDMLNCIDFDKPCRILDAFMCDSVHRNHKVFMATDPIAIQSEDWSDLDKKQKWVNYRWPKAGEMCQIP